ncbi:MAG TPA: hypothetical protein VKI43_10895 [Vicinamibacterales bacterium]|nr:hypothetical protein [Vicinamibacterales bacterium]
MNLLDGIADDLVNLIVVVIGLLIAWGLTERWRIEWAAKRKRERQNRLHRDT